MCVYFIYFIGLVKNYNFINKSLLKKKKLHFKRVKMYRCPKMAH
jgi:hypothetical protein